MTKSFLIGTVAALAMIAPAQAESQDGRDRAEARAKKSEQVREERSEQRVARQARDQSGEQRQERVRTERPQRQERVRMERPQREERIQMERPQRQERVRMERPQRQERVRIERPQRQERVRTERAERQQPIQRQARTERRERRVERTERRAQRIERAERSTGLERAAQVHQRNQQRFDAQRLRQQQRQAQRLDLRNDRRVAMRTQRAVTADRRMDRRLDRVEQQHYLAPLTSVGEQLSFTDRTNRSWYDEVADQRYRTLYADSPQYFYDYNHDDGYLYRVDRDDYRVLAQFPMLGGAFGVGRTLPLGYDSYNVPYGYRNLYYDTPDHSYRYGDGAIYRVDPGTQLIQAVVALLTGQRFGVGQMLPTGYDAYNVPYAYRDDYYDRADAWYRYDDGNIYQVDPYSRRITDMYPVSYGSNYAVGYPAPSYASYGGFGSFAGYPSHQVPYAYQNLYNGQPGYNYHYANNGIYQVDPATSLTSALVALVTGNRLGVGQRLPIGYDAYNVPSAYRDHYYDTADNWYRYDDGYIYQVDPGTRMIETMMPVSYGGYSVGYPVPAAYPGYDVPGSYQDLYYPSPGYDYRYFDGGIYQVNPQDQMVQSVAALVTGHNFGVGQMMPAGYDAYNVPYAYRDRYYDSDRSNYRYADGYIYQVDPQTRLIQAVIDAIV